MPVEGIMESLEGTRRSSQGQGKSRSIHSVVRSLRFSTLVLARNLSTLLLMASFNTFCTSSDSNQNTVGDPVPVIVSFRTDPSETFFA